VFERVSVFVSSFDIDAAQAVAGFEPVNPDDVLDAIAGIVSASMLVAERTTDATRYQMLATMREFAQRTLEASGVVHSAEQRHAHHHIALAAAAGGRRFTPSFTDAMARLEASRDDVVAALEWSLAHEPSRTIEAAAGLNEFWSRRGDVALAYRFGRAMLDNAPGASNERRAEALLCASFGAGLSGDFELAARGPSEAIELAAEAGWRTRLWAFHARGQIGTILGDIATIEAMGHAIVDLCVEEDLDLPIAYGESLLGLAEFFADRDYHAAVRHLDAAIEGMRALGDLEGMKIYGLVTAISAAALKGDYDAAERYAAEAISLPGLPWTASAYIILGGYALHPKGDLDRARLVLERGTRIAYETSTEIWLRTGFLFLARVAAKEGHWEHAARLFGACRPNLPAWGHDPRWWGLADEARTALGEESYCRLKARGEHASPDEVMGWIGGAP
jgi:tetratricopeptide (TPR) repeat protein